ncbi:MAG: alpha/beta hydrolase-fold protein [Gemmatimonadaceae bacterium]
MPGIMRWCVVLLLPLVVRAQPSRGAAMTIGVADSLYSPTLREQRPYLVYTPPSYKSGTYLPRSYPVLYLLDGDAHFHSVTGLLQILGTGVNGTFVLPEMIVVAIPNTDRMRDLTPSHVETDPSGTPSPAFKTSGGMPAFLDFIRRELIPHIDSAYRTAPYRMLVGHSLGGITAINALYTMPETFNAYVAIDPSLWYDKQLLLKKAREYFDRPAPAGRALFMAQANTITPDDSTFNEHFNSMLQFNSIVESYNRSGVRYAYKYYPSDDHGSVPLIAEYDALRFIFDGFRLNLLRALDRPASVAEHFDGISRRMGYRVLPPESMVDMLGRFALGRDSTKAVELLQMNTQLYPRSPHAFVELGNLLLARGDSGRARSAYQSALALSPDIERARGMMRKLKAGG